MSVVGVLHFGKIRRRRVEVDFDFPQKSSLFTNLLGKHTGIDIAQSKNSLLLEPVAECRHQQVDRRHVVIRVVDRVDPATPYRIVPVVGDDAVTSRMATGSEAGVSGGRMGHGVPMMGVGEDHALVHQPPEAGGPERIEPLEIVASELIDDDQQQQSRRALGRLGLRSQRTASHQAEADRRDHEHSSLPEMRDRGAHGSTLW